MKRKRKRKYGLILVHQENGDDYNELVELFLNNKTGEWTSFCKLHVSSVSELKDAYNDIKKDGLNTWFFNNGKFEWIKDNYNYKWDWTQTM